MKNTYIQPEETIVFLHTQTMLSASKFDESEDDQEVTPDDDDYNGGFSVKGYNSGHYFEEW